MRTFVVFLPTSLDGSVEEPNGAMDTAFFHYSSELEKITYQLTKKD
ncbi:MULTISPECIES: hypothetical protein [unclassified Streptococcus]|nr:MULTISPECIES: hypothetical protein [unclassified Streptococcus]